MAATVANLTLVATKTEQMGSNDGPSLSLSTLIVAFAKSIWANLSHLKIRLAPVGLQEPAFRLCFERGTSLKRKYEREPRLTHISSPKARASTY